MTRATFALAVITLGCGGSVTERTGGTDGGTASDAAAETASDAGATCGGIAGLACPSDMWCSYATGTCKTPDAAGVCRKREALPCVAPMPGDSVCGCDGKTYQSQCVATSAGVSVDHPGGC